LALLSGALAPCCQTLWFLCFCDDRCFSSSGEASNVDDYLWLMSQAKYKPIIEYCGGTEIGGGFVTGSMLQPQSLSLFSTPAMGCKIIILDDRGHPLVSTEGVDILLERETKFTGKAYN